MLSQFWRASLTPIGKNKLSVQKLGGSIRMMSTDNKDADKRPSKTRQKKSLFNNAEMPETPKAHTPKQGDSKQNSAHETSKSEPISKQEDFLQAGEFLEPTSMFISQKVGDLYFRSRGANFEQTLEIEVTKETLAESQQSVKSSLNKFSDTFDFANESKVAGDSKKQQKYDFSGVTSALEAALTSQTAKPATKVRVPRAQHVEEQTMLAFAKLQQLKEELGDDVSTFKNVTLESLRRSQNLRSLILDYKFLHFFVQETPKGSMIKDTITQTDKIQSIRQSGTAKDLEKANLAAIHNFKMQKEFIKGEEGLDFVNFAPGEVDPSKINEKSLEREIRKKLQVMRQEGEIELADDLEKKILGKNTELDFAFAQGEIPIDEVKFYPGSDKGPAPEDDPETYSRWFVEHQAPSTMIEGQFNCKDLGVKRKFIKMVRDDASMNEIKQATGYFFDNDELFPMQTYKGQPEFELFNRDSFNVNSPEELPQITFMSNTGLNELAPQHNDNTLNYQDLHSELERWAIFRSLPQLMNYDRSMSDLLKGIASGAVKVPEYSKTVNPATLFAYYSTLPSWCRNHSLVTNALYALEFHQPRVGIRDKELALNFVASYLRPIDGKLLEVIKEVAAAKKIRMNIELGKQMMNELRFYDIDPHEVGEQSDDEIIEMDQDITAMLSKGVEDEEDKLSIAQKMIASVESDERRKERSRILEQEMNIADFQVEPEVESCMTDFYRKPYAEIHEIQAIPEEVAHVQPVNYFDNDDGFWTEYIQYKHMRMEANDMIVNRKFLKH